MSLVERLGFKTLDELWNTLDSNQIFEWIAYDRLKDPEFSKRLQNEINLEQQKHFSLEDEANAIKQMFMNLQKKK